MARVKLTKNRGTPTQRIKKMRKRQADELSHVLRENVQLHDLATQGWSSRNKPDFWHLIKHKSNTQKPMRLEVKFKAKAAESATKSVYELVRDGTRVRHARLKWPYEPKTAPNTLGQQGRGGQVLYVSRAFDGPGIKPRNFDKVVSSRLRRKFRYRYRKGTRLGMNDA